MEKEDIVVLKYTSGNFLAEVVSLEKVDKDLSVNLENKIWSYLGWNEIPIGQSRPIQAYSRMFSEAVIGVYDRTDTTHLSTMVHDAIEATKASIACLEHGIY